MKIAYITMAFPAPSETFASNDVRELAARGVDMAVHALRPRTDQTMRLVHERSLERVHISHNHGLGTLARGLHVALKRPRLALDLVGVVVRHCVREPGLLLKSVLLIPRVLEIFGALEKEGPDVVHAFWSHYPSMVVYLIQRYMPTVVTSMSFGAYDIVLRYPLSRPVALKADFVRTLAHVNLHQVEQRFGVPADRVEVIYNGVDLDLLPYVKHRTPRSVLTAGRLIDKKGMGHVIRAFARLHERWPDATLSVCGSGPMLKPLQSLAEELGVSSSVMFAGHLPQREMLVEMRKAEVFMLLSETASERLPNVVKEAMVCGCICISSRSDGINELINDGLSGFIVDARDLESVVDRVDSVFTNRVPVERMRVEAEAHIRKSFALATSVERYMAVWSHLLSVKQYAEKTI